MDEYIDKILKFLPINFIDQESNDFLTYLKDTYIENIQNKKYQFAFKAFHMLYMTCIYKFSRQDNIIPAAQQMFDYSHLTKWESEAIRALLKKKWFHKNDLSKCQHHVDARNHCSHASGKIEYDEKGVDFLISDELKYIERLQKKTEPELKTNLQNFIDTNWNNNLSNEDVQKWIEQNNLSEKDIETLTSIDFQFSKTKSNTQENIFKKILYLIFLSESSQYIEIAQTIFIKALKSFMNGLSKEISIINEDNETKKVSDQKIIEEYIIPLLDKFKFTDPKEINKILKI